MNVIDRTPITHYWALHIPPDRWCVLQKARSSSGVHYSISGGTNDLRVVTADEAAHINRTGKLPDALPPASSA